MQTWRGDLATTHAPRSVPRGFDSSGLHVYPDPYGFWGVAPRRYRIRPAASMLGFAFSAVFVAAEMSVRSIDLFLVSRNWAVAYRSATSETVKQAIAARIEIWDLSVAGLYFGLLGVHMLSSICFAIATWDSNDAWNRAVAVGFSAGAMEGVARLAEGYLGQGWLSGFNHALYFPIVLLNFGTLAVWLGKQAKTDQHDSPVA